MKRITFIFRNILFYRWPYLAILVGVIVSTAVLTGALLVGDSVRGSLGRLAELRLGKTEWAMQPGDRYFRSALADELSKELDQPVIPLLQLTGIGVNVEKDKRIQNIQVVGVNNQFASLWNDSPVLPKENEVVISENLASRLTLAIGDPLLIRLPKLGNVPQNAPFVADETPAASLRLTVVAIASEEGMGRFSLKSNQRAPFNAFVSMSQLADRVALPGSANLLLIPGDENLELTGDQLNNALGSIWKMADAGIEITPLDEKGLFQVNTNRIFFDDLTAQAIQTTYPDARPLFTYLANNFSSNGNTTPYSFIAAVDEGILRVPLSPGEIVVTDWLAADLGIRPGDSLSMTYFVMGPLRRLTEKEEVFKVSGIIPLQTIPGGMAMMPDFPGISRAGNCSDWETGAPVELDLIRNKDEAYWNEFKGTPKAFITLEDGERLWDNPFGIVTAFRFKSNQVSGIRHPASVDSIIMSSINPSWHRFVFQPVREQGQLAAVNSTDFGGLFVSLSFFLIASSLLLTGLLFSLHARRRISEVGVLAGLGFRKSMIMRIFFSEVLLVMIPGVILGSIAGIVYNKLILFGLDTLWQDAVRTSMLQMEVNYSSLGTGAALGFILAGVVLYFTLRKQLRQAVSERMKGTQWTPPRSLQRKKRLWMGIGITFILVALALIISLLADSIASDAGLFLAAGGLMMAGGISLLNALLIRRSEKPAGRGTGFWTMIFRLGSMKRGRSMAAISLLALGTFTVIITGANRKTFYGTERDRKSGTGGFLLWTESTMPLLYDLNTMSGKTYFALEDEALLQDLQFLQLHRLDGNDASCLNLNQVPQPMMLGIPVKEFDSLDAFRLVSALPEVDPEHPWLALKQDLSPGVIPAYADQSVITWGLQKKIGDTLLYIDEAGRELHVKLMGGLENSIFQGHILVSDSVLKKLYPSISGTRIMLVEGSFDNRKEITTRLEELFVDYGLLAVPASERLAEFNSVENTYLSVFMLLGALGVLIGTVGFGIILWRNNLERSSEIALYLAIGFRRRFIRELLIIEYLLILISGMVLGIVGAVAGILPSLISPAYQMPGWFLLVILLAIWTSGAVWILIPIQRMFNENLTQTLQQE